MLIILLGLDECSYAQAAEMERRSMTWFNFFIGSAAFDFLLAGLR
jgi:hypothetical protein